MVSCGSLKTHVMICREKILICEKVDFYTTIKENVISFIKVTKVTVTLSICTLAKNNVPIKKLLNHEDYYFI